MARLSAPRCGGLASRITDIKVTYKRRALFFNSRVVEIRSKSGAFTRSLTARARLDQAVRFLCDFAHTPSRQLHCILRAHTGFPSHRAQPRRSLMERSATNPVMRPLFPRGRRPGSLTMHRSCSLRPRSPSAPPSRSTPSPCRARWTRRCSIRWLPSPDTPHFSGAVRGQSPTNQFSWNARCSITS